MSNAPYLLPRTLPPKAFGHMQLRDSMIVDGLWDPYKDISMGSCAETCADEMSISREAQVSDETFAQLFLSDHTQECVWAFSVLTTNFPITQGYSKSYAFLSVLG